MIGKFSANELGESVSCCHVRLIARQAPLSMGILQARILEWIAISFSRASSQPRDEPRSSALQADSLLSELPGKPNELGVKEFRKSIWLPEWDPVEFLFPSSRKHSILRQLQQSESWNEDARAELPINLQWTCKWKTELYYLKLLRFEVCLLPQHKWVLPDWWNYNFDHPRI